MKHKISKEAQKRNKRYDCIFNAIITFAIIGAGWASSVLIGALFKLLGV